MEGVGSEISWGRWEGVEAGEGYSVRSRESRGEMEGGCEDPGECPSDHNPSIPWDLYRHSLDHTSETDGVQEESE
jgi:hypothetical protein